MFLLRAVVGLLFVGHGTQKLFGWWGGPGLDDAGEQLESMGYRPGREHAALAGGTEAAAGVLLALGLFTPLAAAAVIGVMVNAAVVVHLPRGPWSSDGGYEYNLVLATVALALAFAGPGRWSLDAAAGWNINGAVWGIASLLLGLVVGGAVVAARDEESLEGAAHDEAGAEADRAA